MISQTASYSPPSWINRCRQIVLLLLAWSLPTSLFGMQAAIVLGIVLLAAWTLSARGTNLQVTPLDRPMAAVIIAVGLSLLLAPEGITSFHTATSWWVLVTLYVTWFMLSDEATLRTAVWGILLLSAAVSWFGVYQSQTGNYPLSSLIHPNIISVLREVPGTAGQYGAIGLFYSRITLAHVLLFPFCWALSLALEPFSFKQRSAFILLATSLGMGIVMTWTRAALVVVVMAVIVLFFIHWRSGWARKIIAIAAVLILMSSAVYLVPQNLVRLKDSFSGGHDWGRLTIWQTALDLTSESPVTGCGWGNFSRVSVPRIEKRLAGMGIDSFPALHDWAHSNLLTVLSETGSMGAFAFCYLLVTYFRRSRKTLAQLSEQQLLIRGFVRGAMVSVACFLANGFVHDTIIHAEGAFMFWFTLGASLAVDRLPKKTTP